MPDSDEVTILLTGASGQVGFELQQTLNALGRVIVPERHSLDLANPDQIRRVVREVKPDLIVNPAAYTAVDKAEADSDAAMAVNGLAPGIFAEEAKRLSSVFVHYSTDYVFDGAKPSPYVEDDVCHPLGVYGATKLAGERAVEQVGGRYLVFRTSWVYGARGRNFLLTMLRLAKEHRELRVVTDQTGAPTWAVSIAQGTADILRNAFAGHRGDADWWEQHAAIYHMTCAGAVSWAEFASAIFDSARLAEPPVVIPITTEEYPTPAKRPRNSRLSNERLLRTFGVQLPDWRDALTRCMAGLD
ncbi:dTDP-4-dehydrorhamnose reductase [Paraburkholderia rhizosphaerae]|uniref:dTDP-4-dehydrorhamnose reductase n=1 Tax=Paraburkholderia rhizosphaerae TaxID=480658 RepID=A0A4R8L3L7_9BURK|nr:dTDP-4-dehydrorhamnose reductase [Paraburkholderia rhizosphaerae]TDY37156.1 dTDP-4-dehydrorhamnose reductase [Paraburkholderia rhizosphaerae]